MATTREELLRVIAESPDDVASWLLYADWLQQQAEPRGELIALDVALETATGPRRVELEEHRRQLIANHAAALLGDTFAKVIAEGYGTITWRRGFVDAVSYIGVARSYMRAVGWLIKLMCEHAEPFAFMRTLSLTRTDLDDLGPLTRFTLLTELDVSVTRVSNLTPLRAMPQLRRVHLGGCGISDAAIASLKHECPRLKVHD